MIALCTATNVMNSCPVWRSSMQTNLPLYETTLYNKIYIHQRQLILKTENSTFWAKISTHICLDVILKKVYTDCARAESCEKENKPILFVCTL